MTLELYVCTYVCFHIELKNCGNTIKVLRSFYLLFMIQFILNLRKYESMSHKINDLNWVTMKGYIK